MVAVAVVVVVAVGVVVGVGVGVAVVTGGRESEERMSNCDNCKHEYENMPYMGHVCKLCGKTQVNIEWIEPRDAQIATLTQQLTDARRDLDLLAEMVSRALLDNTTMLKQEDRKLFENLQEKIDAVIAAAQSDGVNNDD